MSVQWRCKGCVVVLDLTGDDDAVWWLEALEITNKNENKNDQLFRI